MDQQEGLCDAETGEPGVLMLGCDLPRGHEGDHHAEYDWPQEPSHPPRELSRYKPPEWAAALLRGSFGIELRAVRPGKLAHVVVGQVLPESHRTVLEAYWREFGRPPIDSIITAAMVNEIVDWWNARDDGSTIPDAPKEG